MNPVTATCVKIRAALPKDSRFRAPEWRARPYNVLAHSFLSVERWWERATTGVRGVSKHHEDLVSFGVRRLLDTVAPSNFAATNPAVLVPTPAIGLIAEGTSST